MMLEKKFGSFQDSKIYLPKLLKYIACSSVSTGIQVLRVLENTLELLENALVVFEVIKLNCEIYQYQYST